MKTTTDVSFPKDEGSSETLASDRQKLAKSMAGESKFNKVLGQIGAGAQAGYNAGSLVGGILQHGPTKTQSLDTSGDGVMNYFGKGK